MPSFDIVSKLNSAEVDNAMIHAQKEINQRFDFKNTFSELERKELVISVRSSSEDRLNAVIEVLHAKFVKRGVSLKHLDETGKVEPTAKGHVKKDLKLQEGIAQDRAKEIVKAIKDSKLKVSASIQADVVRVSGKDKDELQRTITLVRSKNFPVELQFTNFRD